VRVVRYQLVLQAYVSAWHGQPGRCRHCQAGQGHQPACPFSLLLMSLLPLSGVGQRNPMFRLAHTLTVCAR
jgi:hypothetical protein